MQETKQKEIREKCNKYLYPAKGEYKLPTEEMIADFFLKEFDILLQEEREKAWEYVVKAMREESANKEDFINQLENK